MMLAVAFALAPLLALSGPAIILAILALLAALAAIYGLAWLAMHQDQVMIWIAKRIAGAAMLGQKLWDTVTQFFSDRASDDPKNLRYNPSPKHDDIPGQGVRGSKMDLPPKVAERVLRRSYKASPKRRYGYKDGKYYEFKNGNDGTWHGYRLDSYKDVPKNIRKGMSKRKMIPRKDYRKG
ncbi:MAG: hypothetical protein QM662_13420 [Gordonia sp. (in: high G+C Gram-positive bacteria)]